jgi:hypothetical protein
MFEKVKLALQSIVARFEAGVMPEGIAYSAFRIHHLPVVQRSL